MKKFNKGNKFDKRDSGRSESRSFSKPRGERRFERRDPGISEKKGHQ